MELFHRETREVDVLEARTCDFCGADVLHGELAGDDATGERFHGQIEARVVDVLGGDAYDGRSVAIHFCRDCWGKILVPLFPGIVKAHCDRLDFPLTGRSTDDGR